MNRKNSTVTDLPRGLPDDVSDLEADALTRVYQLERQIESAHAMLDLIGVPQDYPNISPPRKLTISGRLNVFNDLMPGCWEMLKKAVEDYIAP